MKKIYSFLLLLYPLLLLAQTTSVTTIGSIGVTCSEYVNNMHRTWDINIPGNRRLQLDYNVMIEPVYDKVYIYSIDYSGTEVLQATLTGSQTGSIQSLYTNGRMKVVFTTDISVNCGNAYLYSGFTIDISKIIGISYSYDGSGNRNYREIVLDGNAGSELRSSNGGEEMVFQEKIEYGTELEVKEIAVRIYPNPTEGRFAVEITGIPEEVEGDVGLFDMQGQVIARKSAVVEQQMDFDLSGNTAGVYLLKIRLGEKVSTWKVIKK
jgi:hypothetical protein